MGQIYPPELRWFDWLTLEMALAPCVKLPLGRGVNSYPKPASFIYISPCSHRDLVSQVRGDGSWTRPFPWTLTLLTVSSHAPSPVESPFCLHVQDPPGCLLLNTPQSHFRWLISFYNASTNKVIIMLIIHTIKKGKEERVLMHCWKHVMSMSVHISALPKFLLSPLEILVQHRNTSCRMTLGYPQTSLLYLAHSSCKAIKDFQWEFQDLPERLM